MTMKSEWRPFLSFHVNMFQTYFKINFRYNYFNILAIKVSAPAALPYPIAP